MCDLYKHKETTKSIPSLVRLTTQLSRVFLKVFKKESLERQIKITNVIGTQDIDRLASQYYPRMDRYKSFRNDATFDLLVSYFPIIIVSLRT